MKITIDFDNKIIEIIEPINLGELIKYAKYSINDWKKWTIQNKVEYTYNPPFNPYEPINVPFDNQIPKVWYTTSTKKADD